MIVKIQEEGSPMSHIYFSAFSVNVDKDGRIIIWAKDSDNRSYMDDFNPSSYQIVVEKENDVKAFYKKHM